MIIKYINQQKACFSYLFLKCCILLVGVNRGLHQTSYFINKTLFTLSNYLDIYLG